MNCTLVEITDASGLVIEPRWLSKAESVHRELRPHLSEDYQAQMQRIFAGGGRMLVAVANDEVLALAVYRQHENSFDGWHCYVDDLVTAEHQRSMGIGEMLLRWIENSARDSGCTRLKLDSGTQRGRAHQFYFREGLQIASFHFYKDLD